MASSFLVFLLLPLRVLDNPWPGQDQAGWPTIKRCEVLPHGLLQPVELLLKSTRKEEENSRKFPSNISPHLPKVLHSSNLMLLFHRSGGPHHSSVGSRSIDQSLLSNAWSHELCSQCQSRAASMVDEVPSHRYRKGGEEPCHPSSSIHEQRLNIMSQHPSTAPPCRGRVKRNASSRWNLSPNRAHRDPLP